MAQGGSGRTHGLGGWLKGLLARGSAEARARPETGEAPLRSELRLAAVLAANGEEIWEWEVEDDRYHLGPRWAEAFGVAGGSGNGLLGLLGKFLHHDDLAPLAEDIAANLAGRVAGSEREVRALLPEGQRWVLIRGGPSGWDRAGAVRRMTGTLRDVTERRRREDLLRLRDRAPAEVLEALEFDTLEWDLEARRVSFGPRLERLLGRPFVEGGLEEMVAYVHPDDRARVRQAVQAHLDGRVPFLDVEVRTAGGIGERWLLACGAIVERDQAERPRRILAVARDVSGPRAHQRRFDASERLAVLGRLVAAIAHELNSPLAVVFANLDFAERAAGESGPTRAAPAEVRAALAEARLAQRRVTGLLRQLGAFAMAGERRRERVSVQQEIGLAVSLAEANLGARLALEAHFGEVPEVLAAPGELAQVAAHVLEHVGRAGATGSGGQARVAVSTSLDESRRVLIEVRGPGPGEESAGPAFDWFFRLERSDLSAGLGLAMGRAVMAALGGEIEVSEGGGTVAVRMLLPPAPAGG
jgi:PAS domain-containing protein/nitrogen-specific signal transduction histidine kinase